jgi:hypothetical protein
MQPAETVSEATSDRGAHNNSSVCLTKYTPRVSPGLRSGSGFRARSEQHDCFLAGGAQDWVWGDGHRRE